LKFYAYWKSRDKTITAYEAIQLKDKEEIETKQELAELFDVYTDFPVIPFRRNNGNRAFFRYYQKEHNKNFPEEYDFTPERTSFLEVFQNKKEYKIRTSYDDKVGIKLKVSEVTKLKRIKVQNNDYDFFVIDLLLKLEETKPFSYFYKWNGLLALELKTTSKTKYTKQLTLGNMGFQIFEAIAKFPKDISLNIKGGDFSLNNIEPIIAELDKTYNRNYFLQGDFINEATINLEYKEKYDVMKNFEEQCEEMKVEIRNLREELAKLIVKKEEIEKEIKKSQDKLNKYNEKNGSFEDLIKKEENLKKEVYELIKINTKLESSNKELESSNKGLSKWRIISIIIIIILILLTFLFFNYGGL